MKRFTLLVFVILFVGFVNAQTKTSANKIKLETSNSSEMILDVQVSDYSFKDVQTPNGIEKILVAPNATTLQIEGAPNLPKFATSLVIADDKKMQIEVYDEQYIDIENINIAPSKGIITRNIDPSTVAYTYGEQYTKNEFFPNTLSYLEQPFIQRDIRGITVKLTPFQYNPVTKTLRVYTHMKVRVFTNGETDNLNVLTTKSASKKINDEFAAIYKRSFLNYGSSLKYTPIEEGTPGKMLIISDAAFLTDMQPFVDWKNQKGIETEIVDVATIGNTAAAIKTYVEDYYTANPEFCYLLLVGDGPQVSTSSTSAGDSDNDYGYLVGSDHRIDIFVGRFSATTSAEVTTQVDRTVHYEKDITAAESWMQHALCIASNEGAGGGHYGESDIEHEDNIKADFTSYGYTSVATCYQDIGTSTDISNAINDHCGIITYTGHGDTQEWYSVDPNAYTNTHVNALTNDNHLPFIFSVACVAGDFVSNTCFGEAWQRATNGGVASGAIANIASTINQSWQAPMEAQDEFVDILIESYSNNIKRTFGGISANGWGLMIDAYNTDGENMADTWTCFGDASVMVRTKQPTAMTITHAANASAGATNFLVNCDEDGALVSITINNVIYGTAYAAAGAANVSLSPALPTSGSILVTVTAYNRVTYQLEIPIGAPIPPTCDFSGTPTTLDIGNSVTFTDLSTGSPTAWDWTFTGADVTSSIISAPPAITYSVAGTYEVILTCTNAEGTDTESKPSYIHVIDPNVLTADFSGTPTTILPGQSVDFTDLSNSPSGTITSWAWTFAGADVTASSIQHPTGIVYNTIGDYTVKLVVSNDASQTDEEEKIEYIHVIDPSEAPQADFVANQTILIPGDIIDYTNLSTLPTMIDSSQWILESADAPNNNIYVSGAGNLAGVAYNAVPGYYDATLIIFSSFGTDTMFKDDYIHILDTNNLGAVYARFRATTNRLIPVGSSVSFETIDEEIGDAQYFEWTFEGGTPATYTGQYPPAIYYNSTEGSYDVALKVWNASGANDSLNKEEYVVVITQWPWGNPDGFCDEITNMESGEMPNHARHINTEPGDWGYFPGHNSEKVKYYAEKFTNYTFDHIQDININNCRIYNASTSYNKVTFYIWEIDTANGMPGAEIDSKIQYISDFSQGVTFPVQFDSPVPINEEFYAGFKLEYPSSSSGQPQDTFAVYYSGARPNGPNTVVCAKSLSDWKTPTDMMGDTMEISLDLSLRACLVSVKDIFNYADEIDLYPNPSCGNVTIELGNLPYINPDLRVYDITGRMISVNSTHVYGNTYKLNMSDQVPGIYMITFDFGGTIVTKKLTLIK
jgi:PKD repeat protein